MKNFPFIVMMLCSMIFLLLVLFYPCQNSPFYQILSSKVLATGQEKHNVLSHALSLSLEKTCTDKIEPHGTCYYYVTAKGSLTFAVTSGSLQKQDITLLSDTGSKLSGSIRRNKNTCHVTLTKENQKHSKRIFLCLTNPSVSTCTVQIQVTSASQKTANNASSSKKHTASPKPTSKASFSKMQTASPKPTSSASFSKKRTASPKPTSSASFSKRQTASQKPASNTPSGKRQTASPKPTSKAASNQEKKTTGKKRKLSTKGSKKAQLYPQFCLLSPDTVQTLTVKNISSKKALKNFVWISVNPNVATVENGNILALAEGTSVIYLQDKKNPKNTSSCFVRVIKKERGIFSVH
jgi:hypothetical protein